MVINCSESCRWSYWGWHIRDRWHFYKQLRTSATGVNWGRTAWININYPHHEGNIDNSYIHEGTHWRQQQRDGFAKFYGTTVNNYASAYRELKQFNGYNERVDQLYNGNYRPGNYEHIATNYEYGFSKKWNWTK